MKIKFPKKSLGQNFLTDKNIINIIVKTANIKKNDTILEVGPGTGNLTEKILLNNPKKIIAVEKDSYLVKKLFSKFNKKIIIINDDILKIDESKFATEPIVVFGNLPYNISTQILVKWIRYNNLSNIFKKFILMFQKEVAERIIAESNTKKYGRISILSSWKLKIKKIVDVSASSFYPSPKVKSSVLLIEPKDQYFNLKDTKSLEYITNVFFNQRRKMIKKPLSIIFKNVNEISKKLNLNINDRPQNLSLIKYLEICREYENLNS